MIRIAQSADIPAIRALMQGEPGFFQGKSRSDMLDVALASAGALALVCEENGLLIGFACAHDVGFRAYLSELIVLPSQRRRGIGTSLVRHIQNVLKQRGCAVLFSDVWKDAVPFYSAIGWSKPDVELLRIRLDSVE